VSALMSQPRLPPKPDGRWLLPAGCVGMSGRRDRRLAGRWPADGRVLPVETDAVDGLPATVVLPQIGVFVNADDEPAPRIDHVYVYTGEIDGRHVYRYGLRLEKP